MSNNIESSTLRNNFFVSYETQSLNSRYEFDRGWGWQRILLLMIILQSIGIRAFPMQVVLSCAVVCLILAPRIKITIRQFLSFIILSIFFVLLSMRGMSSYTGIVYLILILFTAFFYIRYVENRWAEVEFDLLQITWWLSLHGLVSYLVYKALPHLFITFVTGVLRYKVFGIFILTGWDPIRAAGLCWEPGLLQYVANLSLFLGIKHSWPPWKLAVSFFTVVVTYSTTGIIVLIPVMLYLLIARRRSMFQWILVALTLAIVVTLGMTLFQENITNKFSGRNESGLIRLRDTLVGLELIQNKPLIGHGQFDNDYLSSHSTVWQIERSLFSKVYLANVGEMYGGYTNGFLGVWAGYGIFIGAYIYWCFYNNLLLQGGIKERITFFMISILTFISEPITNTSLFFVFAISGIYSRQQKQKNMVIDDNNITTNSTV